MTNEERNDADQEANSSRKTLKEMVGQWYVLTSERFPPLKYGIYSSLFVGAVQMSGPSTPLSASMVRNVQMAIGTFLILWFMRVVDEIKDLEHDRRFHPDRPVASGKVSIANAILLLGILGLSIASFSVAQSWTLAGLALSIMLYSLLLWGAEQAFYWFEKSMILNITFAIQLKTLLIFYVGWGLARNSHSPIPVGVLAVAIVCHYLHWEILRKTHHQATNEKSYSNEIGWAPSLLLGVLLLVVSNIMVILYSPLQAAMLVMLTIAALPSLIGTMGFVVQRLGTRLLSVLTLTSYLLFLSVLVWFRRITVLIS